LGGMLTGDPSSRVYAASVFFVILMARELSLVCTRVNAIKATDPDSPVYFSPYVFPCYVYSSRDNYLTDESDTVNNKTYIQNQRADERHNLSALYYF
jgi:hypothetical protein